MADNQNEDIEKQKGKLNVKPPKINIYWVYGIIAVILLGMQFIGYKPASVPISWEKFNTEMLQTHDVEKLEVVNGKTVEIYIKKDRLTDEKYKLVSKTNINTVNDGPHYSFNILSPDDFSKKLDAAQQTFAEADRIPVYPVERANWGDWVGIVLPIIVIIGLWLFVMRRVAGGMGGGGGQIFNFGKSKATLFDKGTKVNVTFNDVAGLDEAK
ncbi:MAG: AAA family ATPase, partial [Sphingobacteriales bacterium]